MKQFKSMMLRTNDYARVILAVSITSFLDMFIILAKTPGNVLLTQPITKSVWVVRVIIGLNLKRLKGVSESMGTIWWTAKRAMSTLFVDAKIDVCWYFTNGIVSMALLLRVKVIGEDICFDHRCVNYATNTECTK